MRASTGKSGLILYEKDEFVQPVRYTRTQIRHALEGKNSMQNPGFITLNGHRIKVQRWHQESDSITFTTVIHGEHIARNIESAVESPHVNLLIDEETTLTGSARLLDRRATGAGATAVMRLEIRFTAEGESATSGEITTDQKLDLILTELRALRREVSTMQGRSPMQAGGVAPPRPGKTLIDFEIPVEGDENK